MTEPTVMEIHATELGGLKPGSVVQAAEADLKRRVYNMQKPRPNEYQHYAFHRKHVIKAETPRELIEMALKDARKLPEEPSEGITDEQVKQVEKNDPVGINSGKKWTRIIYRDVSTLEAALAIFEEKLQTGVDSISSGGLQQDH